MMMKSKSIAYLLVAAGLTLVSCDDFLDKMPDDRAEINTAEKVTKLLVSAYPATTPYLMQEMASDNVTDNGAEYQKGGLTQEEAYLWKDFTGSENDAPHAVWNNTFVAVAAANQALKSIEELGGGPEFNAQRGEALICRAYSLFMLANCFCMAYSPETADQYLGLPYPTEPETTVKPEYSRGTLRQLYDNIQRDIEAALPLIDDNLYTVPKYHFNKKAAYAFAARFYLYSQQWDKAIEAANAVLGTTPEAYMRDWKYISKMPQDYPSRCDEYISASSPANLLLMTSTSLLSRYMGASGTGMRYSHNNSEINSHETFRAPGLWGSYDSSVPLYMATSMFGKDEKVVLSKYGLYYQYVDKVNGTGYPQAVTVTCSGPEVLLIRAEAYAVKNELDKALADLQVWVKANAAGNITITTEDIEALYGEDLSYSEYEDGTPRAASDKSTPKKRLHPSGFSITDETQEAFIHCILHIRRLELFADGRRWEDIKRYGIEIAHKRDGQDDIVLRKDDPRRALQLPSDVIAAGLEANPRN